MSRLLSSVLLACCLPLAPHAAAAERAPDAALPALDPATQATAVQRLVERHGAEQTERIRSGVRQVAQRWWPEDGGADEFIAFCTENFITEPESLEATFQRLQRVMEQIDGHLHEVRRELLTPLDLDSGPIRPVDRLLSGLDLAAHVDEDLFKTRVPFLALLNYPVTTLTDRLHSGPGWDRRTWAVSRMMDRFAQRTPATVNQAITRAFTEADQYVAAYFIRMDRLVTADGTRPFREGLRLISHWGLRDELKAQYAEAGGLDRQRMIRRVMERIVNQEIPLAVIDNAEVLWDPWANMVSPVHAAAEQAVATEREPDTRYARWLELYRAVRQADPFTPTAPTYIDRRFNLDRQIPESAVEALLMSVLASAEFRDTAALISRRLGRPLEAFDIWYNGFAPGGRQNQADLDRLVSQRYPDVQSFQAALPTILRGLGFTDERALWLAQRIVVDPSRGAGHAMGAVRREDQAHLRTRIAAGGMDYKGYNIAIHELGHNVEQTFSLAAIDHWWLNGVPNTAFTEALAFVFQNRDLELLGLDSGGAEARQLEALDTLWGAAEIGGVALLDMQVWRWLYAHPQATPAELRQATLSMAREIWNRHFAPVFGVRDQEILAIYSHMIVYGLYLPDYPLGQIIAFQLAARLREGDFGAEFERVARLGRLTPDAWMRGAVGGPISTTALLAEAREALLALGGAEGSAGRTAAPRSTPGAAGARDSGSAP